MAEGIVAHNTAIKKSDQPAPSEVEGSPVPSDQREKDNTETPISNSEGKDVGGIDLRNIPIIQQPLNQGNNVGRPTSNILPDSEELETTRKLVELAVEYKHIPEIKRLKQWITLSLKEDKFYQELNKILSCLVGILRLQEEDFLPTPESLTKLLSLLEQDKPPEELISSLEAI